MSSLECPGSKTSSFRKAGLREKLKWCKGAWCTDSCVTGDLSIRINWTHLEITRITLDDTSCSLNVESRLIFPFIYTATAYTLRSSSTAFPSSSYLSKSVFKSSPKLLSSRLVYFLSSGCSPVILCPNSIPWYRNSSLPNIFPHSWGKCKSLLVPLKAIFQFMWTTLITGFFHYIKYFLIAITFVM